MAIRRRSIATALVALVLIGAAAYWWQQPARQQQPRFGRGGGDDGPVPVIAALTQRNDVPVYLDGVGTAVRSLERALGEQGQSPFTEAMKQAPSAIEALTREVEAGLKTRLP